MKRYYIEDSDGVDMDIPSETIKEIVRDYLASTYYWSAGIACLIIGFLLGIIASN